MEHTTAPKSHTAAPEARCARSPDAPPAAACSARNQAPRKRKHSDSAARREGLRCAHFCTCSLLSRTPRSCPIKKLYVRCQGIRQRVWPVLSCPANHAAPCPQRKQQAEAPKERSDQRPGCGPNIRILRLPPRSLTGCTRNRTRVFPLSRRHVRRTRHRDARVQAPAIL